MATESKTGDDNTTPANPGLVRMKIKLIANYIMLGFAPVVSVLALVIAVIAITGNKSGEAQLSKAIARIDSTSTSLSATKAELENIRIAMAHDKAAQEAESRMQDDRGTKIIQAVTKLQVKMKVSPTLEEQLREAASASAVKPAVSSVAAAPATPAAAAGADKKPGDQVKALKEAIEQFNRK